MQGELLVSVEVIVAAGGMISCEKKRKEEAGCSQVGEKCIAVLAWEEAGAVGARFQEEKGAENISSMKNNLEAYC